MKSRAERRKNNCKKANRKLQILKDKGISGWFKHNHQASDGKIHCSCPMCRCKTRDKKNGDNWSIKDEKRMEQMEYEVKDEGV